MCFRANSFLSDAISMPFSLTHHTHLYTHTNTQAGWGIGGVGKKEEQSMRTQSIARVLSKKKVGAQRGDGSVVEKGDDDAINDALENALANVITYADCKMGIGEGRRGKSFTGAALCKQINATLNWLQDRGRLRKGAFKELLENGGEDDGEGLGVDGGEEDEEEEGEEGREVEEEEVEEQQVLQEEVEEEEGQPAAGTRRKRKRRKTQK